MGEADVRDSVGRVLAVLRGAGRAEGTVRRQRVVLDRFAVFLAGRGLDTASERVCIEFIANQTGVRLGSLREPVSDRGVQAVRRPVVLMADVLAGRAVDAGRPVVPAKDHCPAGFRPLRDDYLASCRRRGNAEATVVAKDRAASRLRQSRLNYSPRWDGGVMRNVPGAPAGTGRVRPGPGQAHHPVDDRVLT